MIGMVVARILLITGMISVELELNNSFIYLGKLYQDIGFPKVDIKIKLFLSFCYTDDGYMKKFIAETKSMTPEEKASYLEYNREMGVVHEDCAQEGQTQAPPRDQAVVRHFITLISHNNKLYELDGRKEGPVCHGEINKESFLESAAAMVKKFMARDPEEMDFSVMALAED
ncbi:ubiquitin carboxyl-terminal hydrolase [Octopus bimaculoides]|nr:ubiquitin carboxyl-terminal hydrolase [Octopus bimaculoides]